MSTDAEARDKALALLESHHDFPGLFEFRAVVLPESKGAAVAAVAAAVGGEHLVERVTERRSSKGKYVSVRVRVQVESASTVLEVYEVLKVVRGVMTVL